MKPTVLIRQAVLWNGETRSDQRYDVLIRNGLIDRISDNIENTDFEEFSGTDLHLSIGWLDLQANFRDPGHEHKEDLLSGLDAAQFGGFSRVVISPSTFPPIDSKSQVSYVLNRAANHAVKLMVAGAITKKLEGKELAEMFDMAQAGAVVFSQGKHALNDARLAAIAMQYVSNFGGKLMLFPLDPRMTQNGTANEGIEATMLGLRAIPALAEELVVQRDLSLAEYTGVAIHISHITTPGSVAMIREAKKRGLPITTGIPAHHLLLDDSVLRQFDSNHRVLPPLRSKAQIEVLRRAVIDGTIDVVFSDHEPHDIEAKQVEFNQAEPGMATLCTAFAAANSALGEAGLSKLVNALTAAPRQVLGMKVPTIKEGEKAELTLFSPTLSWKVEAEQLPGKGRNCPVNGWELIGKPLSVFF